MTNTTVAISESDSAALHLLEQAMGYTFQASLRAVAELCVADCLVKGPKTPDVLGKELGVNPRQLYRVMRMVASKNIFKEHENGEFSLTPSAEFLRSDVPGSLRAAVLMLTHETLWLPLGNVIENIRGESAFKNRYGMNFYEYWAQESAHDGINDFDRGMSSMSSIENNFIVRSYHFPDKSTVVDIAGGMGGLLLKVLQHNPTLHGILFDQPQVLPKNRLSELGDDSRWELHPGSFFESCPTADFYMLKYITMDWPEEQARNILRTCRNAMHAGSKLLIMEPVIPRGNAWHGGKEVDLLLLASFDGGQTRSEDEIKALLADADLKLNRIIDTGCYVSIVEAEIR